MNEVIKFIKVKDIEKNKIFSQLKCSVTDGHVLQYIVKEYIVGNDTLVVVDILEEFYDLKTYEHLKNLALIKNLLELGWLAQNNFNQLKLNEVSTLELLNSTVTLSSAFLKLLEEGSAEFQLPESKQYSDHLEYLQDQFSKIDLAQQLNVIKQSFDENSPNIDILKSKMKLLDNRIKDRVKATSNGIMLEDFFKEYELIKYQ